MFINNYLFYWQSDKKHDTDNQKDAEYMNIWGKDQFFWDWLLLIGSRRLNLTHFNISDWLIGSRLISFRLISSRYYAGYFWGNPVKHYFSSVRFSADLDPSIRTPTRRLRRRHNWSDCYSVRPISSAARIGRRVAMQPVSCAQGKAFRVKPSSSGCCLLLHHHRLFVPRERGTPESCGAKHKSHFLEHFTTVWPNWKYDKYPDAPTSRFPIVKWKFRSTLNNFLFPKSSKQINNRHYVSVLSIKRSYVSKMASNTNQPTFLLSSNKPVHCPFSRAASQLVSLWC